MRYSFFMWVKQLVRQVRPHRLRQPRRTSPWFRPHLVQLEDRWLPSTSPLPSLSFTASVGLLSINAGPGAHNAEIALGALTGVSLTVDGQNLSKAAMETGASASSIHAIQFSGGGPR
jgi:hypothetical protein